MELKQLSPNLSVRPQVRPDEIERLAAQGFKGIINNRPDGEEPGQPSSAELEAEARRHGLFYTHIPVVPGQATEADAKAFADALEQVNGPVVAFCKSGGRASSLFEMTRRL